MFAWSLVFFFLINFAGPTNDGSKLDDIITQSQNKRQPIPKMKKKWVDDMTILTSIDLKTTAVKDTRPNIVRPLSYHSRTEHIIPEAKNISRQEVVKLQNLQQSTV